MHQAFCAFQDYLNNRRQKLTPQRQAIFRVFAEADGHPSPEDIHRMVRAEAPGIGLATVYRTMHLLAEAGLARELKFNDGVARYEFKYGRQHHDHIICTRCQKSVEVMDQRIEELQTQLAHRHDFEMTGHKMYLYGLCSDCQNADKSDK